MFFLGQYNHNLDDKGRLTIPARFRDTLTVEGAYIMQGFDSNLLVLTEATFDELSQRLNQASLTDATARLLRRLLFSTASRADFDRAGRILIPQYLRETAGINADAVVVGAGKYVEIWSAERWASQLQILQEPEANASRFEPYSILFS
ncbi:MAG TPA: division/cell wall cluster transcriptional repressor MraZ [Anaerolineales bacterium]|nr:division/cell wall cluster transcriptional repressor MraZ [Anaerolineales bacterium]